MSAKSARSSAARAIPPLPEPIWGHICRYLTSEQVRTMYSLNRPLYRISMALRYQEASVGKLQGAGSEGTRRCLSIVDNAELRGHVHSLVLTSSHLGINDHSMTTGVPELDAGTRKVGEQLAVVKLMVSRWKAKVQPPPSPIAPQFQNLHSPPPRPSSSLSRTLSLSRRKTREQIARDEMIDELKSFLGRLPKLTSLTVHQPDPIEETDGENMWSISLLPQFGTEAPYSTGLRSLTVSGSIKNWKHIIPHHHEWPHLEKLSVRVHSGYQNVQDNTYALRLELAPFIRRHSSCLKCISFTSELPLDLTSLYDGMGLLPVLNSFKIEQPYLPPAENHGDSLNQFLFRHRDTLKSLMWTFINPSGSDTQPFILNSTDWFEQPVYHLTLPVLRHLHLSFPGPSNPGLFEGILYYCARHASTLTRLSLSGITFTLAQFQELLLLAGSKRLEELDISLDIITSAVLINLSSKFPSLKVLRLAYNTVGRQKSLTESALVDPTSGGILKIPNVPLVRGWQFRQDMATLVLSKWLLEELFVRKNGDREYKIDQVGKWLVKSLPRVTFINGLYREKFL